MSFTPEQQKLRRSGITGSWVAAICGLDSFRSPIDAWDWYVNGTEQPRSYHMDRGIYLEDGIAQWYASRQLKPVTLTSPGITKHPHRNHMCTPDRLVHDGETTPFLLSVKCPWRGGPDWGEDGTDKVPLSYYLQLQWEMYVCGAAELIEPPPFGDLAATIFGDLRTYRIKGDIDVVEGLVEKADKFWRDHVLTKTPPPPNATDSYTSYLARRFPTSIESLRPANAEVERLAREYKVASLAKTAAETAMSESSNMLRALIGDSEGFAGDGFKITWRSGKGKPSWKAIATEAGASATLIQKHTPQTTRYFRATFGDENDGE
jgi:putative phage-type endonuclease